MGATIEVKAWMRSENFQNKDKFTDFWDFNFWENKNIFS